MKKPVRLRWAWWLLAYASLGLGIIGIFLPGLPTTVFVLIAAWAAARGSRTLHQRLLAHPQFGPLILDWQRYGAVPRRAKWLATATMAASALLLLLLAHTTERYNGWMAGLPIACMAAVGTWLWLRPEPPTQEAAAPPAMAPAAGGCAPLPDAKAEKQIF